MISSSCSSAPTRSGSSGLTAKRRGMPRSQVRGGAGVVTAYTAGSQSRCKRVGGGAVSNACSRAYVLGMGGFNRWAAERTPQTSAPPNLVFPSPDRAFAALVQHRLVDIRDPSQFEDADPPDDER